MSVLDLAAGKVTRKVAVGGEPEGVTLRPDGKAVYVTSEQDNQVVAVDTRKLSVIARIADRTAPARDRVLARRQDRLRHLRERRRRHRVRRRQERRRRHDQDRARRQDAARPAPDGRGAVARRQAPLRVERPRRIDRHHRRRRPQGRAPDRRRRRPPLGHRASAADGKKVYTANGPSNDVSVVDVATGKVEKRIKVGGLPWGIAVK